MQVINFLRALILTCTLHVSLSQVLFITLPDKGHFNPVFFTAKEVCKSGNLECTFASYDYHSTRELVDSTKVLHYLSLGTHGVLEEMDPSVTGDIPINSIDVAKRIMENFDLLSVHTYQQLSLYYQGRSKPKVILSDYLAFGGIAFGNKWSIPVLSNHPLSLFLNSDPWTFPVQFTGRSWPNMSTRELLLNLVEKVFAASNLQQFNLPRLCNASNVCYFPKSAKMLYNTYDSLEYQRAIPTNVKFTGPLFERKPVKDITQRQNIIYISFGTVWSHTAAVMQKIYDGVCIFLESHPEHKVVWQLKHHFNKINQTCSSPIEFVQWVNQPSVLNDSILFITHGGFNGVIESLYYSTPMLLVPIAGDQPDNAIRVQDAKAGKFLFKTDISAKAVSDAIDKLMDKAYVQHASIQSVFLQSSPGVDLVIREINLQLSLN